MRIRNNGPLNQSNVGIPGTPGAEQILAPSESNNERVFSRAVFDPFMVPEIESYIKDRGIRHLILTGLYGDTCVDASVRSGFQRNLWISIVDGCVGNLHLRMYDWKNMARNMYGARQVSVDDFLVKEEPKASTSGEKSKLV